jgi:hypothetical protein
MIVFRGNGATGTVVDGQNSLITRQTNGAEGPQIADRALDQAVWFHTPIDQGTGETKMFLYTGRGATNQHYVLKEVANGVTPNRDTGNAISQRQGSTGGFIALQAASPEEGTSVKLYAYDMEPYEYPELINVDVSATVVRLEGNRNQLTIAIVEHYNDGGSLEFEETFSIHNNAEGTYAVGPYQVYVDTKGNTQIRDTQTAPPIN